MNETAQQHAERAILPILLAQLDPKCVAVVSYDPQGVSQGFPWRVQVGGHFIWRSTITAACDIADAHNEANGYDIDATDEALTSALTEIECLLAERRARKSVVELFAR